jgi:N-acetylmuramic acid 6-phosphate etherase
MTETLRVGVDLGKTGCRVRAGAGEVVEGAGAPGLADPGGVEHAVRAVRAVLQRAVRGQAVSALVIGAAGAEAGPDERKSLADGIAALVPGARIGVASDSVTAHVGALGGRPGTVLAVGTGSVALGFSADGRRAQVDGWGPWLGDDGSGAWIGRTALRAVLSSRDGRGARTGLTARAQQHFGDLDVLPRTLHGTGGVAAATATFVPEVVAAAALGDDVAGRILDEAARLWVELSAASADAVAERQVSLVGGLASVPALVERFSARLAGHLDLVAAQGTPLDGALLLAERADLPHEPFVLRVDAVTVAAARTPARGSDDVDVLATEQVRDDLRDLDDRDADGVVDALLDAEATVPQAMSAARATLADAVRLGAAALASGGRMLYVGAGTPGRLAALDAAECPPTFGTAPDRVVAVLAGGTDADRRAVEGAEDDAAAGARDLTALAVGAGDLVVGITASGRTPYVLAALETARAAGAATVAIVNNAGSPAAARSDVAVELLTGAEVLAGSTRLKSGTAQKIALNTISTGAMVANGKTYGAWMVDMVASNEKLRRRARRILREAGGIDDERAGELLEQSGWHTRTALVAALAGVPVDRAAALLDDHGGRVRAAVAAGAGERT